jgi:hypothetical protein
MSIGLITAGAVLIRLNLIDRGQGQSSIDDCQTTLRCCDDPKPPTVTPQSPLPLLFGSTSIPTRVHYLNLAVLFQRDEAIDVVGLDTTLEDASLELLYEGCTTRHEYGCWQRDRGLVCKLSAERPKMGRWSLQVHSPLVLSLCYSHCLSRDSVGRGVMRLFLLTILHKAHK